MKNQYGLTAVDTETNKPVHYAAEERKSFPAAGRWQQWIMSIFSAMSVGYIIKGRGPEITALRDLVR